MKNIEWMKELAMDSMDYPMTCEWGKSPFFCDGNAIVTDGYSLVRVRVDNGCKYPLSQDGEKACRKFLEIETPGGDYPLESLQAWAAKCKLEEPDYSLVFGCFVDRNLLFKFTRHLEGGSFRFGKRDNGEGDILVFAGDGWKCVVMGLRKTAMNPNLEYPSFPEGFKCPTP